VEVADKLPAPPVLIGHSMGGMVIQKYLEKHTVPAWC
jgi:non-heme chloroperoxidase